MRFALSDYYMGRDVQYQGELTAALRTAAADTVARVNRFLEIAISDFVPMEGRYITSGWRPVGVNATTPNAAQRSKHITCQACDIADPEGDLDEWALVNQDALVRCGLWLEHPSATKGWCHVQTVPPRSGNRVFYP